MDLKITTTDPLLFVVLRTLAHIYDVRSEVAIEVLYWMCLKADPNSREVVIVSSDYRHELGMSQQNFHNNIRTLKDAELIEGERGLFKLNAVIPLYLLSSDSKEFTLTINYQLLTNGSATT